jgi:hypothetical protein
MGQVDIVDELMATHRNWTSGEQGCRDCGTSEPCVSQRAAAEIIRLRNMLTPPWLAPKPSTAWAWGHAVDYQLRTQEGFPAREIPCYGSPRTPPPETTKT